MKATVGPWTVMNDHHRTNIRKRMALVNTPHARSAIDCTGSGATYPEDCANARLISAAPDLLASLKALMAAYDSVMPGIRYIAVQDYKLINDAPCMAAAAIAKAEGR